MTNYFCCNMIVDMIVDSDCDMIVDMIVDSVNNR